MSECCCCCGSEGQPREGAAACDVRDHGGAAGLPLLLLEFRRRGSALSPAMGVGSGKGKGGAPVGSKEVAGLALGGCARDHGAADGGCGDVVGAAAVVWLRRSGVRRPEMEGLIRGSSSGPGCTRPWRGRGSRGGSPAEHGRKEEMDVDVLGVGCWREWVVQLMRGWGVGGIWRI